jgi:hypothetical protein
MPYTRPGVYTEEQILPNVRSSNVGEVSGVFVGTADRGPLTPTLVNSWTDFTSRYGSFSAANHELPHSVYHFFANGGSRCYVRRVTAATAESAGYTVLGSLNAAAGTPMLRIYAANPGTWGNGTATTGLEISVSALANVDSTFSITVKYNDVQVEQWSNLSLKQADPRFVETVVNSASSGSVYITASVPAATKTGVNAGQAASFAIVNERNLPLAAATVSNKALTSNVVTLTTSAPHGLVAGDRVTVALSPADPVFDGTYTVILPATNTGASTTFTYAKTNANVTSTASAGSATGGLGADGSTPSDTEVNTAVNALSSIQGPFLLNVVGRTSTTVVDNANTFASGRKDVFVIVDADATASQAGSIASIPGYAASSYGAAYFPRLLMVDPSATSTSATRMTQPGGAVMGRYFRNDALRGVYKTPAGINETIVGAIATEYVPTNTELGTLNDKGSVPFAVNAIIPVAGAGISIMGGRTLKTGAADQYISVRRTLIYVKTLLEDLFKFALFEPNDEDLWEQLETVGTQALTSFWQAGGLKGEVAEQAFFVTCDATNNPPASVAAGTVTIDVGVAVQNPAEFVVVRLGMYSNGATATTEIL